MCIPTFLMEQSMFKHYFYKSFQELLRNLISLKISENVNKKFYELVFIGKHHEASFPDNESLGYLRICQRVSHYQLFVS